MRIYTSYRERLHFAVLKILNPDNGVGRENPIYHYLALYVFLSLYSWLIQYNNLLLNNNRKHQSINIFKLSNKRQ